MCLGIGWLWFWKQTNGLNIQNSWELSLSMKLFLKSIYWKINFTSQYFYWQFSLRNKRFFEYIFLYFQLQFSPLSLDWIMSETEARNRSFLIKIYTYSKPLSHLKLAIILISTTCQCWHFPNFLMLYNCFYNLLWSINHNKKSWYLAIYISLEIPLTYNCPCLYIDHKGFDLGHTWMV